MKLGHPHHLRLDRSLIPHWQPGCTLEVGEDGKGRLLHVRPGGNVQLDDIKTWISELVDGRRTVQQIIDTLHVNYPNLPEMGTDVDNFIGRAHQLQWIELSQAGPERYRA
ncbi:pyrroloquinoline quinone biosynthesis peptide chaperone PqqD [Pseudomonas syringae]|nr:pyrroloquinoline quinone biosynthesis peptide chaperone PqqD [Pseudomonas syringae]MBD8791870.1 pyrroloquinoline quinone biosynthesis peptide chaperone PqqD [Pseudomonas syringae]MBD8802623.1 pyrroloquinoline quinone biosynthesis peptide chaperone PqqD [Pseudomonas syringae]MBD8813195.1 pyrroloquinoline quinone biosynthesis peptide chaperone PqqD [Pseudomonas syringae]